MILFYILKTETRWIYRRRKTASGNSEPEGGGVGEWAQYAGRFSHTACDTSLRHQ